MKSLPKLVKSLFFVHLNLAAITVLTASSAITPEDAVSHGFKEIPVVVQSRDITFGDFKINHQSNRVRASSGEMLMGEGLLQMRYHDDTILTQAVVGIPGVGGLACIYHNIRYACGESTMTKFFFQAPQEPGTYEIYIGQMMDYTPADALKKFDPVDMYHGLIGIVIVE